MSGNTMHSYEAPGDEFYVSLIEDPQAAIDYIKHLERESQRIYGQLITSNTMIDGMRSIFQANASITATTMRPRLLIKRPELSVETNFSTIKTSNEFSKIKNNNNFSKSETNNDFFKHGFAASPTSSTTGSTREIIKSTSSSVITADPPIRSSTSPKVYPAGLQGSRWALPTDVFAPSPSASSSGSSSPSSEKPKLRFDPTKEFKPVASVKFPVIEAYANNSVIGLETGEQQREYARTPSPPLDFSQVKQSGSPTKEMKPSVALPRPTSSLMNGVGQAITKSHNTKVKTHAERLDEAIRSHLIEQPYSGANGIKAPTTKSDAIEVKPSETSIEHPQSTYFTANQDLNNGKITIALEQNNTNTVTIGGIELKSDPLSTIIETPELERGSDSEGSSSVVSSRRSFSRQIGLLQAPMKHELRFYADNLNVKLRANSQFDMINTKRAENSAKEIDSAYSLSSDEGVNDKIRPATLDNDIPLPSIEKYEPITGVSEIFAKASEASNRDTSPSTSYSSKGGLANSFDNWFGSLQTARGRIVTPKIALAKSPSLAEHTVDIEIAESLKAVSQVPQVSSPKGLPEVNGVSSPKSSAPSRSTEPPIKYSAHQVLRPSSTPPINSSTWKR